MPAALLVHGHPKPRILARAARPLIPRSPLCRRRTVDVVHPFACSFLLDGAVGTCAKGVHPRIGPDERPSMPRSEGQAKRRNTDIGPVRATTAPERVPHREPDWLPEARDYYKPRNRKIVSMEVRISAPLNFRSNSGPGIAWRLSRISGLFHAPDGRSVSHRRILLDDLFNLVASECANSKEVFLGKSR